MEREFNESLTTQYRKYPKKKLGLFEHEYEFPITEREWEAVTDNAEKCLTNFFNSDVYQNLQSRSRDEFLEVEKLDSFDFEGTKIWVMLDLAVKDGDNLLIIDWKTGKVRQVDMDIQLACYSLYASERYGYNPENIFCKKHNVRLDVVDDLDVNTQLIDEMREYMRESIKSMKVMLADEANNAAREEDFQVTDNDDICKSCNFRKACPKWAD